MGHFLCMMIILMKQMLNDTNMKSGYPSLTPKQSLKAISALITAGISGERFGQTLRRKKIPHLSFSQVAAIEFCHQRYYLDYIEAVQLDPIPNYFIKGKLLHQFIASSYTKIAHKRKIDRRSYSKTITRYYDDHHGVHLENAVQVHLENLWQGYKIVGVEKPFVIAIDDELPPFVGVIDLLLKKGNEVIIIDHKSGNDFYAPDNMQMAIYQHYGMQRYPKSDIKVYYDQYRWVNNLNRMRKPPMLRSEVRLPSNSWFKAMLRIRDGYRTMQKIREGNQSIKFGECFQCPFKPICW